MEIIHENKKCVIKAIGKTVHKCYKPTHLAEMRHEYALLNHLGSHPNIVECFGYSEATSTLYLEKGDEDLYDVADFYKWKMEECMAATFISQICEGLKHSHEKGIVHNDVKTENIIFVDGTAKLIDFDLSFRVDRAEHILSGTYEYICPEKIAGKKELLGPKIDSWCVGILCYEIMNGGGCPFDLPDRLKMMRAICAGRFEFKRELSLQCQDFIRKLLNVDAAERMGVEEALEHSWIKDNKV